jgi:ATP-dependent RNA helicase SUPV3L1/SUV3
MGLNLKINRIIFSTIYKIQRGDRVKVLPPLVRQIAGRAGRSNTDGFVTTFYRDDLDYVKECISQGTLYTDQDINVEPIKVTDEYTFKQNEQVIRQACLFPPVSSLLSIAELMSNKLNRSEENKVTLVEILELFEIFSNTDTLYFIKDLKKVLKVVRYIQDIKAPIQLHYSFAMAPCKTKEFCMKYLKQYFNDFVTKQEVRIPDDLLVDKSKYFGKSVTPDELKELQDIHNAIEIYTWLANKYKNEFIDYNQALMFKGKVTETINFVLGSERRSRRINIDS